MQFWFVSLVSKYVNFAAFSVSLLYIYIYICVVISSCILLTKTERATSDSKAVGTHAVAQVAVDSCFDCHWLMKRQFSQFFCSSHTGKLCFTMLWDSEWIWRFISSSGKQFTWNRSWKWNCVSFVCLQGVYLTHWGYYAKPPS